MMCAYGSQECFGCGRCEESPCDPIDEWEVDLDD